MRVDCQYPSVGMIFGTENDELVPSFESISEEGLASILTGPIKRLSPSNDWPFEDILEFLRNATAKLKAANMSIKNVKAIESFEKRLSMAESCHQDFAHDHSLAQCLQGRLLKDFAKLQRDSNSFS